MCTRDLPPDRSLEDNRDPPGGVDGRARSPGELLDNLRLRLSQLPENHPSAWPERNDGLRDETWSDATALADSMSPPGTADEFRGPAGADDEVGDGSGQVDGRAPVGGSLADLITAIRDTSEVLAEAIGDGMLDDLGTLPGGIHSEPYRPWFMSGEPGVPWFVVDGAL